MNGVSYFNRFMTKSQFSILLLVIMLFGLFFSNPKEDEHRAAVKDKLNAFMMQTLKDKAKTSNDVSTGLGFLLGGYVIDQLVNGAVTSSNYGLFSTTNFNNQGQNKMIGVGILGNVFITGKIDDALAQAMTKQKR